MSRTRIDGKDQRAATDRVLDAVAPSSTLGPDDLVFCAGTLLRTPLLERIPIVAEAGFSGMSIFTTDIEGVLSAGVSLPELRQRIEDAGLRIAEVDPLMLWYPSARAGPGLFSFGQERVLGIAEALGARSISAVVLGATPGRGELEAAFGSLCDAARERGLLVHLEFMPFSVVSSLADATRIVRAVDRPNGGIMLDVWHLERSGGSSAEVARAARQILGVQLNDAPHEAELHPTNEALEIETAHRRLLPGDGDAGVPEILRALRENGSTAPLGVEVYSDELAALPPREVAARSFDAASRVRDAAR